MGYRATNAVNVWLSNLRKTEPEKLKEPGGLITSLRPRKRCPQCGAERGTKHIDCNYTGAGVRTPIATV
jgi:hypothetical protein